MWNYYFYYLLIFANLVSLFLAVVIIVVVAALAVPIVVPLGSDCVLKHSAYQPLAPVGVHEPDCTAERH